MNSRITQLEEDYNLPPSTPVPVIFLKIMGISGGIFLAFLCKWSEENDWEWFSKTSQEITLESAVSRREQDSARKKLIKLGITSEKRQDIPSKIYFKINLEKLISTLKMANENESELKDIFDSFDTRFHYTYKITHVVTEQFYIGVRSSHIAPEEDINYMGSGNWIKELDEIFNLKKEIIEKYPTRTIAEKRERELIKDAIKQYGCMNIAGRELL